MTWIRIFFLFSSCTLKKLPGFTLMNSICVVAIIAVYLLVSEQCREHWPKTSSRNIALANGWLTFWPDSTPGYITVVEHQASQRWSMCGRCLADCMYQKVSGIPRLPLSDLRSAREWLGGDLDVLIPGWVTIFPVHWEHAARTTKVPTCTDSSSKIVMSESREAS